MDRYNHKPYSEPGIDRLETDLIYLPEFMFDETLRDKARFAIGITELGNSNMTLIMNLYMNKNPNSLFGYCASNDYCVTSDPSNPDFEIAKVVSYDA